MEKEYIDDLFIIHLSVPRNDYASVAQRVYPDIKSDVLVDEE